MPKWRIYKLKDDGSRDGLINGADVPDGYNTYGYDFPANTSTEKDNNYEIECEVNSCTATYQCTVPKRGEDNPDDHLQLSVSCPICSSSNNEFVPDLGKVHINMININVNSNYTLQNNLRIQVSLLIDGSGALCSNWSTFPCIGTGLQEGINPLNDKISWMVAAEFSAGTEVKYVTENITFRPEDVPITTKGSNDCHVFCSGLNGICVSVDGVIINGVSYKNGEYYPDSNNGEKIYIKF